MILASTVILGIGVENKPQALSSPRQNPPFIVKNAVLGTDFKQ